jgi:peptide/nickel transport system permease protein
VHPVIKLLVQRIALGLLLLLAVSAVIFLGVEALPGDTAQAILGQQATPEALANLREKLGLNEPPITRYFTWLGGVLTGDLGTALTNGADIATSIGQRLGNTLFLAGCAAAISVPLAIILGLVAARYAGKWPDKVISGITLTTISLPEFVAAYFVIYLLTQLIPIFQPVALSAYVETAELKGLSPMRVIWSHAFPNAVAPVVSVVMLNLAYLVVGVVVVEVVFGYNALGQYLVDHVTKRDLPVVQAVGLIFAAVYIFLNMLADVIGILANPRLRHPK